MKVAVLGAGGVRTPLLMRSFMLRQARLGLTELALMDVAELSPPLDRDNVTARVAARLIHRVSHAATRARG